MHDRPDHRSGPFLSVALIATVVVAGLAIAYHAPPGATVPIHFTRDWTADRVVSPLHGLLVWTGRMTGFWTLMATLPQFMRARNRREGFAASLPVYDTLWITLTVMMGILAIACMEYAMGNRIVMGSLSDVLLGAFFVLAGNGLGKLRPNDIIGIRTPWTKNSTRVWNRTHRTCGPVFILLGMLLIAAGLSLFGLPVTPVFSTAAILAVAAFSCGLSWLYWRLDRRTP
ncbi:SdpI family protein [Gluconobacter sp. P1C6_b]|uniref:SdpI family protein n=1 Tax=Gluconobacter sp. P1C6_b TaxID=2762619 RepID=UPI001C056148